MLSGDRKALLDDVNAAVDRLTRAQKSLHAIEQECRDARGELNRLLHTLASAPAPGKEP